MVGGLGLAVYAFGGQEQQQAISSVNAGQAALDKAKADLRQGRRARASTSSPTTRSKAMRPADRGLHRSSTRRRRPRSAPRTIDPLRAKVVAGLDRLFGVVPVASTDLFTFKPAEGAPPFDLATLVHGPDGAPYVIDRATKTVYRIDLKRKKAAAIVRAGRKASGRHGGRRRSSSPSAGGDLLILDAKNVLWRWRPRTTPARARLTKVTRQRRHQWGDDIRAIGTFIMRPRRAACTTCT